MKHAQRMRTSEPPMTCCSFQCYRQPIAVVNAKEGGKRRPSWLNSYRAKKEKAQEVQRNQRGEGGIAGRAGDTQAGEARGEQEARQKRQAQAQPGQAAGGRRTRVSS